jgi:hypothetical protein
MSRNVTTFNFLVRLRSVGDDVELYVPKHQDNLSDADVSNLQTIAGIVFSNWIKDVASPAYPGSLQQKNGSYILNLFKQKQKDMFLLHFVTIQAPKDAPDNISEDSDDPSVTSE